MHTSTVHMATSHVEGLFPAKHNIISSIMKQWSDMTHINDIVELCPLTILAEDGLLHSADDKAIIWLRADVATKHSRIEMTETHRRQIEPQ